MIYTDTDTTPPFKMEIRIVYIEMNVVMSCKAKLQHVSTFSLWDLETHFNIFHKFGCEL